MTRARCQGAAPLGQPAGSPAAAHQTRGHGAPPKPDTTGRGARSPLARASREIRRSRSPPAGGPLALFSKLPSAPRQRREAGRAGRARPCRARLPRLGSVGSAAARGTARGRSYVRRVACGSRVRGVGWGDRERVAPVAHARGVGLGLLRLLHACTGTEGELENGARMHGRPRRP